MQVGEQHGIAKRVEQGVDRGEDDEGERQSNEQAPSVASAQHEVVDRRAHKAHRLQRRLLDDHTQHDDAREKGERHHRVACREGVGAHGGRGVSRMATS